MSSVTAEAAYKSKKRRYKKRLRYLMSVAPDITDTEDSASASASGAMTFNRKAITETLGKMVQKVLLEDRSPEITTWLEHGCQFYINEDSVGKLGNNGILSMACFNHRIPYSSFCSIHDPVTRAKRNTQRSHTTQSRKKQKIKSS